MPPASTVAICEQFELGLALTPAAVRVVSLGEFAEGFEDIALADAFLSRFTVVTLSRAIAYRCAKLQCRMPQRLGENDAWIAATALPYALS